jgi:hypothetical protein
VAGLCPKECARDGCCGEYRACTSSKRRESALLLGQGIGGQFETELLNRLSRITVLQIAWDGAPVYARGVCQLLPQRPTLVSMDAEWGWLSAFADVAG